MPELIQTEEKRGPLFLIFAMILTAMAAGMGWGIRGQYGHETGAMIAGALASLTLVLLFVPKTTSLKAARCAAMMTVAIGIGGSMTYGQTVGLTHDAELVGNVAAWRWGMLGLFIKGGLWIGFGGIFLGIGLGGKRYRPLEILFVMLCLLGLMFLGIWLYNSPFNPSEKILPTIYFSDDWHFEPDKIDMKPRHEVWGGNLIALAGLLAYVRMVRKDKLAFRMGLIGIIAGGLGFSGGQCIQSYHAWNPEVFTTGALSEYSEYFKHFNWWNMMETTFGLVFGAILAAGLWFNQRLIKIDEAPDDVSIPLPIEIILLVTHVILLINTEFIHLPGKGIYLVAYIQFGLLLATIPLIGIIGGRIWPFFLLLTIVAVPIMGKTLKELCYKTDSVPLSVGWLSFVEIPMGIMLLAATMLTLKSLKNQSARAFASISLILVVLLYFGLNSAIFEHAWPWEPVKEWTGRTPNQLIFMVCAGCLLLTAMIYGTKSLYEKREIDQ